MGRRNPAQAGCATRAVRSSATECTAAQQPWRKNKQAKSAEQSILLRVYSEHSQSVRAPMECVVDTGSSQKVATSSQMPLASSAHSMP